MVAAVALCYAGFDGPVAAAHVHTDRASLSRQNSTDQNGPNRAAIRLNSLDNLDSLDSLKRLGSQGGHGYQDIQPVQDTQPFHNQPRQSNIPVNTTMDRQLNTRHGSGPGAIPQSHPANSHAASPSLPTPLLPSPLPSSLSGDPPDAAYLGQLQTEGSDSAWADRIDTLDTADLCAEFLEHESRVIPAIANSLPIIAALVDALVKRVQSGGRIFYVGAGNSGRVAYMDSTELQPTFSADPSQFQALVAGGNGAVVQARENAEDFEADGADALLALKPTALDSVIGISASGRTPFVLGALKLARSTGALTAGITNCQPSALGRLGVQYLVTVLTGAEFVSGSTRLKAGTAAKQILNMISTCTMVQLGKTYRGLMLDVRVRNNKLRVRGRRILRQICGVGPAYLLHSNTAGDGTQTSASTDTTLVPQRFERLSGASDAEIDAHIRLCGNSVKLACAVAVSGLDLATAHARLETVTGHFHRFLQLSAQTSKTILPEVHTKNDKCDKSNDLVLVIDGGGTRCKVTVATRSGEVAHAETGACNINCVTPDDLVAQIRAATLQAVARLQDARLRGPPGAVPWYLVGPVTMPRFVRVWAGIAGLHYSFNPAALTIRLETLLSVSLRDGSLRLTSDSILLAACIGTDDNMQGGLAVLAGTGSVSVAFRRCPKTGEIVFAGRTGGWGYLLGDQGSAFDIGKRALQAVLVDMEMRDDGTDGLLDDDDEVPHGDCHNLKASPLEKGVLASLGATTGNAHPEDLLPRILHSAGRAPKHQIAEIARVVTALAFPSHFAPGSTEKPDQQALSILHDATNDFVDRVKPLALSRKCKPECDALILSGAMLNLAPYRDLFLDAWERKGLPLFKKTTAVNNVADWAAAYLLKQTDKPSGDKDIIRATEAEGMTESL
ncbi:glucokinase regulator family [Ophiostoma piceae UAMH 11346]|uniref:N-acetyl-D-glucosamine kinase n=1 Tax=Ophiostoma piceae (strain UAMH 11346) TaxID=1262450 RepID=S3C7P6_OPHP1|nr:glucokinase regulator family [Ophiostoma piceae UAMH 11346]